ncbi:MAG: hypothetical protein P4L87_21885 [Formivibrio sp.]|nr:hypothetical protein [Formivibrio sp.]
MHTTDQQRGPLLTLHTPEAKKFRKHLDNMETHREALMTHALKHRDKSGTRTPKEIVARRSKLLQCYLLASGNQTLACDYFSMTTGETISRQNLPKQLQTIRQATGIIAGL